MGPPRTSRTGPLERVIDDHGGALFDFALAVTTERSIALDAVRDAVPVAVAVYGPGVGRPILLGAVFEAALRSAQPAQALSSELLEPGTGSPDELQRLSRAVTHALEPRERGLVDLSLRQGLSGEELSEALGVAPGLVSVTVQAAVDQAEHMVGAVLLSRVAQDDCEGLAQAVAESALADPEGLADAVVKHQKACPPCADRRRALVPVASLLAGVPATPAPAELRRMAALPRRSSLVRALRPDRLRRRTAALGHPLGGRRPLRRRRGQILVAVAAIVLLGAGMRLANGRQRPDTAAPTSSGGRLDLVTTPVDLGTTGVDATFEVRNTGQEPLSFETVVAAPWIRVSPSDGTLAPGSSTAVAVTLDRSRAPEGAAVSEIRVRSPGGTGTVPIRAGVERAPALSGVEATPQSIVTSGCAGATPAQVRVAVVEESGVGRVDLHWQTVPGGEQATEMQPGAQSSYLGSLGPYTAPGEVNWWVTATDIRGNQGISAPHVLRVGDC